MMVTEVWCRVTMVGPDGTSIACRVLQGSRGPDLGAVDDLARLALQAKRLGGGIRLAEVSPALRALLDLAGLLVEVEGQAEGRKETLGLEQGQEQHHAGDLAPGDLEDLQ
jgi:hypothetical protein